MPYRLRLIAIVFQLLLQLFQLLTELHVAKKCLQTLPIHSATTPCWLAPAPAGSAPSSLHW